MKTVFKRLISSLLLVVMLVAAVPASLVSAASADIDWEYLKEKYDLTDSQIDAAKDIADEFDLTPEQIDAVEDYYDSLTPAEQEELKEAVKNGEITGPDDLPGTDSKKFMRAMFIATMKRAAKDILNRVVEAMECVTVKNPFDIDRVYDEHGNIAGINFVLEAADDVNVLEAVKSIVEKYDVLGALKMVAGAVLLFDEVSVDGYTVYDLADPSDIRNALVEIYRSNPIEFSTIANMKGNTLATYNFSLACRGVEIELPVSFVINCSQAKLSKIKAAAAKLADLVEVNGDFNEDGGVFSAELEGILDVSDYTDNVLEYLLPEYIAQEYAMVREKLHAVSMNDVIDQLNLKNLQLVAAKLGRTAEFDALVDKIVAHFHLNPAEPNDLKALIRLIDEKNLFSLYVKAAMQKAAAVRASIADIDAADLKNILIALDNKAQIPGYVKAAILQVYGANAELVSIGAAKLKEIVLALEAKAEIPESLKTAIKNRYGVDYVQSKLNKPVGDFYNGDGSYSFTIGNGFAPMGFATYTDAVLNKLLNNKVADRVSKALKAHGYASLEAYVDAVKERYSKIYYGKYDLDMTFTLVLFKTYTVKFVDENGNVIDVQTVVAGDYAKDPYFHGGSSLNTDYTADKSYENVMTDLVVTLYPKHKLVEVIDPEATCTESGVKTIYCTVEGCGYVVTEKVDALGHHYVGVITKEATCTEDGLKTYTCSRCGDTYTEVIPAGAHNWQVITEIPATCTTEGYYLAVCGNCGEVDERVLPLVPHNYVPHAYEPATCTEDGQKQFICTECNHIKTEVIPALGHDWGAWETIKDPTETETGLERRKCNRCGEVEENVIPALGHTHNYIAVVTNPTCTEQGYTTYTCACGDSYVADYVPALGHDYDAVVTYPNCTDEGYTTYTCSVCGDSYVDNYVPALGHKYEAVVTYPNCTDEGYTTYTCTVCGDSYVDNYVDALGHKYEVVYTEATCTEGGYTTYTCSVCGHTYTEYGAALGHAWTWVEVLAPNCTDFGLVRKICARCGETTDDYDLIDPIGHNYVEEIILEPGCISQGVKHFRCSVCGDCYHELIDALGHKWGDWVTIKEPTETETGLEERVCSVCGDTQTQTIPSTGEHTFVRVDYVYPTCTEDGYHVFTCTDCGEIRYVVEGDALGHDYTITTVNATCTSSGKILYDCNRCGHHWEQEGDPAVDHVFESTVTAGTCLNPGYITYTCVFCGYSEVKYTTTIPHAFDIIEKAPTCEEDGYKKFYCVNGCGTEYIVVLPATGHNWIHTETVDPTCGEDGYDRWVCSGCGMVRTLAIPATGNHTWEIIEEHDATCALPGKIVKYCTVCDCIEEYYTDIDPNAHSFKTHVETAPDCETEGKYIHTCIFCNTVVEETVPALGHAWDLNNGEYVAPTCVKNGSMTFTCTKCGATLVIDIPATNVHTWGNAEILKPATCSEKGKVQYTCLVCGEVDVQDIDTTDAHVWVDVHEEGFNCCNPTVDYEICALCGLTQNMTTEDIYYPTLRGNAPNMAFIDGYLIVKIDRMTVGEFKSNFDSITVYNKKGELMDDSDYIGTDCTFVCDACGEVFTVAVIADINGDGKVNSLDYMYVKRYVMGAHKLTGAMLAAADVNVDCKVNVIDYSMEKLHVMYRYDIYENFPEWETIEHLIVEKGA